MANITQQNHEGLPTLVRMPEAVRLSGKSEDMLRRHYGHLLIKLREAVDRRAGRSPPGD
jgi:hypothetical protein